MLLLVVHTIITLIYVKHQPLTNDESDYIEYSKRWLKGNPDKVLDVDDSKTPVVFIAWIPRIVKQALHPGLQLNDWGRADQLSGRYIMVVFFWGVFVYLYLWSRDLYGRNGWWLPILFLLIDPLFMAFSPIVTSDMVSVFVLLAACYHYYKFCNKQSLMQFMLAAFYTGLAFVTKSSMVFIPLIFLLIYFTRLLTKASFIQFGVKAIGYGALFIFIVWFVLNCGFYFHHSFDTWGSYAFKSTLMKNIFQHLIFLKPFPTLLPRPFIQGFDLLQHHSEFGPFVPNMPYKGVFILNQKFNHGVWYYYLVTGGLKFTISFLVLLCWAMGLFIKRFSIKPFFKHFVFLAAPILLYGSLLSFMNPFQQGIRHAMILLPFLFLAIGYVPIYCSKYFQKGKIILIALLLVAFFSSASFFPNIMSYSNEIILDKTNLYHYIAEFNYRYSDILLDTKPFRDANPEYQLAPSVPQKGKFIIPGAFVYNSTYEVFPNYKWLQQYKPVGHYRFVFLLYDVK
jgi:MFS family permease